MSCLDFHPFLFGKHIRPWSWGLGQEHGHCLLEPTVGGHASFRFGDPVPWVGQVAEILLVCTIQLPSPLGVLGTSNPHPTATLEKPLLHDPYTFLSDLISRVKRKQLVSKVLFLFCFCPSSLSFYGVWDFRDKAKIAVPASSFAMSCLCYPFEWRRGRVK